MTSNRDQLKALRAKHGLSNQDIADLLGVSVHIVREWQLPNQRKPMPDSRLDHLKLKLEGKS